jgi:hypothetical protein
MLRIQIWHLGAAEIPSSARGFFEEYVVETYDILDHVTEVVNIQSNVGYRPFQLKPMALLFTDLEEVLMLDADNTPTVDPTFLFEDKRYQATGTLFWQDYWKTHPENPVWDLLDLEPSVDDWEQESGQLLINKKAAWKAILLLQHLQSDLYYSLLNGDKDTFRFSWMAAGVDFAMNPIWPAAIGVPRNHPSALAPGADTDAGFCGHTMGQYDFDGELLFVHHNQLKIGDLAESDISEHNFFSEMKHADIAAGAAGSKSFRAVGVQGMEVDFGGSPVLIPCTDIEFATQAAAGDSSSVKDDGYWLKTANSSRTNLQGWSTLFFEQLDSVRTYFPGLLSEEAENPTNTLLANSRFRRAGDNVTVIKVTFEEDDDAESNQITTKLNTLFAAGDVAKIQEVADKLARQYISALNLPAGTTFRAELKRQNTRRRAISWVLVLIFEDKPCAALTKEEPLALSVTNDDGSSLEEGSDAVSCQSVFSNSTRH